jgi:uncharacterized protein
VSLALVALLVGSWHGSLSLPAATSPVGISVELSRTSAVVALGRGHLSRTTVAASLGGAHVHFVLPGAPANLVFDGTRRGAAIAGTVAQGRLRGTFRLVPGAAGALTALGLYRSRRGDAIAIVQARGLPTWLVELPSGDVHGLNAALTTVGARLGDTAGNGSLVVAANRVTWTRAGVATAYLRVRVRQREVRVGDNAATLTLPPGAGPFPAVAMVHGSGAQSREEFQVFSAYCELLGIAVVADDKRGVGQSRGVYPGEAATPTAVDRLARDAEAEVLFLRSLPQVDRARVGLLGDSQAGWVIARAAAREPGVRFAVPLVGPTVTVGESDAWGNLAGQGQSPASGTRTTMLEQVRRAGPSGFDPVPFLRKLTIPVHWVFADDDRNVPTELCIERLRQLQDGHRFSWTTIHATHTLLELPSGLNTDLPRSRGFGATLFSSVGAWLAQQRIVRG